MVDKERRGFLKGLFSAGVVASLPFKAFAKGNSDYPLIYSTFKLIQEGPLKGLYSRFYIPGAKLISNHINTSELDQLNLVKSLDMPTSESYLRMIVSLKGESKEEMIKGVQNWFNDKNNIIYIEDKNDYWNTLYETIKKKGGDCDDHAFAKYYTLKLLGFNNNELYFILGDSRDSMKPTYLDHIILSVKIKDKYYILDNSYDRGDQLINPQEYCLAFFPKIIFNLKQNKYWQISGHPAEELALVTNKEDKIKVCEENFKDMPEHLRKDLVKGCEKRD